MMKLQLAALAALVPAVAGSLDDFLSHLLHGDDLDFTVTYLTGEKLSTKDKPITKSTKQTVLRDRTALTYDNPKIQMDGLDSTDEKKRYVALSVVWSLPTLESALDDAYISVPWYGLNLSVSDDGTLDFKAPDADTGGRPDANNDYGEVKNGTVQVWEQTEDLTAFLEDDSGVQWPMWFKLGQVWNGLSSKVDYEFKVGEVEFKWQQEGGDKRCDVDEMGAPIEGVKIGDTKSCEKGHGPWADGDGKSAQEDLEDLLSDPEAKDDGKKGDDDSGKDDSKSEKDAKNDDQKDDQKEEKDDEEDGAASLMRGFSMTGVFALGAAAALLC